MLNQSQIQKLGEAAVDAMTPRIIRIAIRLMTDPATPSVTNITNVVNSAPDIPQDAIDGVIDAISTGLYLFGDS
jgi:hypothetical protein